MAEPKASIASATTEKQQRSLANLKPFQPGQSGNPKGRAKGTRHKIGEVFLEDMLTAWEARGKDAIERVIKDRPHEFIKAVVSLMPKEIEVKTTTVQELSDDDLARIGRAMRARRGIDEA